MIVSRQESPQARAARERAVRPNEPDPVRVLTPEEREAFLRSRPDLSPNAAD